MSQQRQLADRVSSLSLNKNAQERQVQQKVLEHLRHNDCFVIPKVKENGELACVYSVGLWHYFKHPEIITVGLPEAEGQRLLLDLKTLIKLGHSPMEGKSIGRCVEHYPIQLEPLRDRDIIREYLPLGDWFYDGALFPVVQLFWSDSHGKFPWEQGLKSSQSVSQTLLLGQNKETMAS